ncbi:3-oxoacyl-(acyl-carrier protein) reductase [Colletotrichum asianum]|uniref:Short-chain dehydrogenase n=1 Tax=Colletotrichum asianum TaxID=702518 RepID=A0A8H3WSM9_9PEZI|nr:short-chain dehydrogenase [Colletotrichum asianum]
MSSPDYPQKSSMQGKTAVVSGSSAGIAIELSTRGANIVLNYPFPHLQAECEQIGAKLQTPWIAVCADLSTVSGPAALVSAAVARFKQIDILVSNAGMVPLGPLGEADADTWDRALNLNSRGAFLLVKTALPHLTPFEPRATRPGSASAATGGGSRIIIVASVASRMPEGVGEGETFLKNISPHFDMVKQGLDQRTPVEGAFGDVKDVAWTVAFLAEERSRWINGEYILLTGGCYIH